MLKNTTTISLLLLFNNNIFLLFINNTTTRPFFLLVLTMMCYLIIIATNYLLPQGLCSRIFLFAHIFGSLCVWTFFSISPITEGLPQCNGPALRAPFKTMPTLYLVKCVVRKSSYIVLEGLTQGRSWHMTL